MQNLYNFTNLNKKNEFAVLRYFLTHTHTKKKKTTPLHEMETLFSYIFFGHIYIYIYIHTSNSTDLKYFSNDFNHENTSLLVFFFIDKHKVCKISSYFIIKK